MTIPLGPVTVDNFPDLSAPLLDSDWLVIGRATNTCKAEPDVLVAYLSTSFVRPIGSSFTVGNIAAFDDIDGLTLVDTGVPAGGVITNPMTTVGDLIQGGAAGTPTRLADVATGNALLSGGVGVAVAWGKVGLTTHVSGILPLANGGSGADLSATGGSNQFVKQVTLGGVLTVAAILSADLTTALTTPPPIGGTTENTGKFSTLTATGTVSLSPANANVVLSPPGTGVVTINPATAGTLDNMVIGGSTPLAGTFTNLTVNGNTIIGDAAADTLTFNAGAWTFAGSVAATRAAGALAAGSNVLNDLTTTFTGDAGGTSSAFPLTYVSTASGSNAFATVRAVQYTLAHAGSALVASLSGQQLNVQLTSTGNATNAPAGGVTFTLSNSGSITGTATGYSVNAPTLSSTGTIATLIGYNTADLGHATLVTNAIGFRASNMTASVTLAAGFQSLMTSGTAKWGFYASGTAANAFNGNVRIGSVVAPTAALDITGDCLISTTLGVTGIITSSGGITMADAKNIVLNTSTGTKIGTATTQKLGLWNVTPVVQPATAGTTTGFTAGAGVPVTDASTFTGGTGSAAYRISDIVLALKQLGAMAA